MSQPQLDWSGWGLTADHDPSSNELWDNGIIQYGSWWINNQTNKVWWCSNQGNNDNTGLSWVSLNDLLVPPAKTFHSVSLAFNNDRTPNANLDIEVYALVSMSLTVLQSGTITVTVDTGSGPVTIKNWSLNALATSQSNSFSFTVPKGATYKINSSGTATMTLDAIEELY